MKNTNGALCTRWRIAPVGIIVLAAIIVFAMTGCPTDVGTGGGVSVLGNTAIFRISNGSITNNFLANYRQLEVGTTGGVVAERGIFEGENWTMKGLLSSTSDPTVIVDGAIQPW